MRKTVVGLTLLATLLLVPSAGATYDPIGSGTTKLTLDKGFVSQMKKQGVKVIAKAPAKLKAGTITLPVSGGTIDPTISKGEIEAEGTIVFQAGNRKVPLQEHRNQDQEDPPLRQSRRRAAQARKGQEHSPSPGKASLRTSGRRDLALSEKVATRLNKKLRTKDFFHEGQLIGTLKTNTQPQAGLDPCPRSSDLDP